MSGRTALAPGTVICDHGGVKVVAGEIIGRGGSALVYEGRKITPDKPDGEFRLIKEIYPDVRSGYSGVISRADDGRIVCSGSEDASALFDAIKQLARDEVKNSEKLTADKTGRRSDFFFSSHELIECGADSGCGLCSVNGNMYILIDTTQGRPLDRIISDHRNGADTEYSIHSLYDAAVYMRGIIEALRQFHDHEPPYLHLDISPDNVYVSNSKLVRLIDLNSASCMGAEGVFASLSQKFGYSAPEICGEEKRPCVQSDLFSAAAVFFNMVSGSLYDVKSEGKRTESELRSFISDKCRDSAMLKDVSPSAARMLRDFLVRGLSWNAEDRFADCGEMLRQLEPLIDEAHPRRIFLCDTRANVMLPENCVQRSGMLDKIRERLQRDNHVFVSGQGGCGKSSVAAMFVKRFDAEYDTVQFCEYSSDLRSMILDMSFSGTDQGITGGVTGLDALGSLNNDNAVQQMYDLKYEQLKKLDSRTLLVIENYNADGNDYSQKEAEADLLRDLHCHIIFNTRTKLESSDYLPVDELSDSDAYEFFSKTSGSEEKDRDGVWELIAYSDKNFLVMNLLARLLKMSRSHDPFKLLELLRGNRALTPKVRTEQYSGGISVTVNDTVENHLLRVFDVSELDGSLLEVLSAMTLVPYSGIDKGMFEEALELDDWDSRVDELTALGWITRSCENISLHRAVSDLLYRTERTKPDFDRLDGFISRTCLIPGFYKEHSIPDERKDPYKLVDFYAARIKGSGVGCAGVYSDIGACLVGRGSYEEAFGYCRRALEIRESALGREHELTVSSYYLLVMYYIAVGDHDSALRYAKEVLELNNRNVGSGGQDMSYIIYRAMSSVCLMQGDYDSALECSRRSLEITVSLFGRNNNETARSYYDMGMICSHAGDIGKAAEYIEESISIKKALNDDNDSSEAALMYRNAGVCLMRNQDHAKAMECFRKAAELNISLFGAVSGEAADILNDIGMCCAFMEDYGEAMRKFEEAFEINKAVGCEKERSKAYYENMGMCYSNTGRYDAALSSYSNALGVAEDISGSSSAETARILHNIGICYNKMGDNEMALECLKNSEKICEAVNDVFGLRKACEKIYSIYRVMRMSRHAGIYEAKLKKLAKSSRGGSADK